jgi:MYXO-CTERM domain-containing protein
MEKSSPLSSRTLAACLHVLLAVLLFAGLAAAPRAALAAGTVTISNKEPQENDGKWKLNMSINYGSVPHLQHIPMLFNFTPTALYERSLVDATGDKPVLTRLPLSNQQGINESMDVGFTDGSGKVFTTTKFDFVVRRDRGFEAGEYTLKITRAVDGVQVGQVQNLKLKGDNPIVDRRAIVFAGEKSKKSKADPGDKGEASGDKDKDKDKKDEAAPPSDEPKDLNPSEPNNSAPEADPPPSVEPRQGGCGCRVAADAGGLSALPVLALGIVLAGRRRHRRKSTGK